MVRVVREREPVPRALVPVDREPPAFAPVLVERLEAVPEDLARVVPVFFAVLERVPVERLDFARVPEEVARVDRELDDFARLPAALRAPPLLLRDEPDDPEPAELPDEPSSPPHLPDITRCAASATASAMIDPSLVALDIMLLAALDAVSAASRPASRILRRAAGLALIAAAAAARPAASISLLIAALASLSTVLSLLPRDDLEEDFEEVFLVDFAIAFTPSVA